MQTGWAETEEGVRYFSETGKTGKRGRMLKGLNEIDGGLYNFDEDGLLVTGFTKIGKYTYYFSKKGELGKKGRAYTEKWAKHEGDRYYFGANGRMVRKKWVGAYYVGKDGKRLKNTVTPDGYLLNKKGKKKSNTKVNGWVKIEKKWYYFDLKKKKFLTDTFKKIDGKRYYLDENGVRAKGWQDIGSYRYYFSSKGAAATGETTIKGKDYLFNKKGRLQINKEIDGYKTDENGVIIARPKSGSNGKPKVLVVPGHGQGDPGATSSLGTEAVKTREFASLVVKNLKDSGKVDVTYYQNGSMSYDMYQRDAAALGSISSYATGVKGNGALRSTVKSRLKASSACAHLWEYDYVLEVHFNATGAAGKDIGGNGSCKGFGVYVNQYKSSKHRQIDNGFVSKIRATGFAIWGIFSSPSLLNARVCQELGVNYSLIETAFIDDGDDMRFYNKNKTRMAEGIASAIVAYLS